MSTFVSHVLETNLDIRNDHKIKYQLIDNIPIITTWLKWKVERILMITKKEKLSEASTIMEWAWSNDLQRGEAGTTTAFCNGGGQRQRYWKEAGTAATGSGEATTVAAAAAHNRGGNRGDDFNGVAFGEEVVSFAMGGKGSIGSICRSPVGNCLVTLPTDKFLAKSPLWYYQRICPSSDVCCVIIDKYFCRYFSRSKSVAKSVNKS